MADFLDQKRDEIAARLQELKPLVDEYTRLQAAATALEGVAATDAPESHRRRTRGVTKRPLRRGEHTINGPKRRGRRKGSGTRAKEALELVNANPGITIAQIAAEMGIKQNYLYRVLPGLAEEGLVHKAGRGWHPKQAD